MERVTLGKTGIKVSRIGFGVLPIGDSQLGYDIGRGAALIEYAYSRGIDFFDTAQYYDTYKYLLPGLSYPGTKAVISSKSLNHSYEAMTDAIMIARAELKRDVIDIFLLHEVTGKDDFEERSGALEALIDAKKSGIIRAAGLSTHHQDVCRLAADIADIDVVFPLINKEGLGIRNGDEPGSADGMIRAIEKCHAAGKGVYAMKVFGGGNLAGEYRECLDFVFDIDAIDAIMIGFTSVEEIDRAVEYEAGSLDPAYVPDISKKRMHVSWSDCMGCGACRDRCPNKAIKIDEYGLSVIDHTRCLTCGYCAPVCPVRALIMY